MSLVFSFDSRSHGVDRRFSDHGNSRHHLQDHDDFVVRLCRRFFEENRMYEVLRLLTMFIVGILLLSEGGHFAHLKLAGFAMKPMTKTTFYFVIGVLVVVTSSKVAIRKN